MVPNLRLPLILICLIWQTNSIFLFSQPTGYINGKVINSTSFEPVPFATIKLKRNQLGVYANAGGDFKIIHNPEFQSDSLIVTCIGYKRNSLAFKDLSDKTVNKIYLTPTLYGLGEVKVSASRRKLGSVTIIGRAIRNIKNNYPKEPFSYIGYYRDYQKREKNYINLNEAIVQTTDNGFALKSVINKYRLLDFRKNMDFPRMNISPYYDSIDLPYLNNTNKIIPNAKLGDQYGNELFILMVHDAIRNFKTRSFSFIDTFSEDFLLNHNFSEPSKVFNNNLLLYKIHFTAKTRITGDSLLISGTIFIQPKDYSIHKLEYSCSYLTREKGIKEMFNVNIEYGYENSVDSLMCLKYISFNNIFNVVDTADNTYFGILDSYCDTYNRSKPFVILEFNNKIDPESALKGKNFEIKGGKKEAKITKIEVDGKKLYIRLKIDDFKGSKDSTFVNIKNIKDINGNILNKRKVLELYQYRELFVQEYNKSLPFKDSCYLQYLPLEQNCISKHNGNYNYWMNTPENINKPEDH
ncbi:MAG: hypothetical protein EPN88_14280 [Bacteroidetes bacterium]|nr:MAG: hypothetical protein EPN88_14280 [Bacteroidota bacterium]